MATEDRGEGIFLQLDEGAVAAWERRVEMSTTWSAHREAHRRNFHRRFSETAKVVDPDDLLVVQCRLQTIGASQDRPASL